MDKFPNICADLLENCLQGAEYMMTCFYPAGAWPEGNLYWNYALRYLSMYIETLNVNFNTDFGLLSSPGISQTGWFGLTLTGATGSFCFGDATNEFTEGIQATLLEKR